MSRPKEHNDEQIRHRSAGKAECALKYPKPKILLIDMPPACEDTLRNAGYNVARGTFGTPYRVKQCDKLFYVSLESCSLPDYQEQEIIIANTSRPGATGSPPGEGPGEGVDAYWQEGTSGLVDPRPLFMGEVCGSFDKIHEHGGLFIVLVSEKYGVDYFYGSRLRMGSKKTLDNWSFLADMQGFYVTTLRGSEIAFDRRGLGQLLERGAASAWYSCTLRPAWHQREHWVSLATNKYGEDIAGLIKQDDPLGCLLILPQMPNVDKILVELLEDWCAEWNLALFPHLEGARWVHRREYEIPRVIELSSRIQEIEQRSRKEIETLELEIEQEREKNKDWYTLLRGKGDELVQAVIRSLGRLGFQQVIDVDEQSPQQGASRLLREDIQIHDQSPVLVIDVKGVQGHPSDDESTQSEKHSTMRIREWHRPDVQPLTIINHQRNLPPRDRDPKAYRDEIIDNAKDTGLGLMTTWDLFKLMRNAASLSWPPEVVKPIFYRTGRIDPVPEHYISVGAIERVWQEAFAIVPSQPIKVGSRLAIEVEDCFEEIPVKSIHIDNKPVEEAPPGSRCGIGYAEASKKLRKGMRAFVIEMDSEKFAYEAASSADMRADGSRQQDN